jgi:hypothetical protein|tara:strand:- start:95 stop:622 length:528 start_codon:yes stop_codon:yes gene_type:complete
MGKKPVVKLRVYRGKTLSFNEDRTIQNENQIISVEHGTIIWKLTMKNLPINGYCKVSVEKVFVDVDGDYKEETVNIKKYEDEIKEALNPKPIVAKTADQLRIEQLEAQNKEMMAKMEAFIANKSPEEKVVVDFKEDEVDGLKELKLEYFTLLGKKPHHMMKEESLIEAIDKFKNK